MVAAIGLATAAVGAASSAGVFGSNSPAGQTTSTQQNQLSPQLQALLYGDGTAGNTGILGQVGQAAGQPRSAGSTQFGNGASTFLGANGANMLQNQLGAANSLTGSNIAATQAGTSWNSGGAAVNAPSQNNVDLSGYYNNLINGDAGANPYLTNALSSAVKTTNDSYNQNQTNLTNQLQRTILPQINQSAALSGQYGGTRQGIAQGLATSDYTNQLTQANQQLADTNSANTIGAQATAFNQGQDRALAAANSLSGQQYGAASQASSQQQQANLANQAANQSTQQFNASAINNTNALNSANQIAGINAGSNLLGSAYGYSNANDNYALNHAGQAAGILAPFTGQGGSSSTSNPYYTNPIGSAVGGATAGLGLYNAYQNANKGSAGAGGTNSLYAGLGVDGY